MYANLIELEIRLPGEPATERLNVFKGLCDPMVSITSIDKIAPELIDYLHRAWERA